MPSVFPRRVLIVASGMTPQVLTETLYALACTGDYPFIPTEVLLITTSIGAELANRNLLEGKAQFRRLCRDYGLDEGMFGKGSIRVITDEMGEPMQDIRTARDNEIVADFIMNVVRDVTSDEKSAVHVSLAGGRKTMSYYAGYALSLFGRDQDRLSHVLVEHGYELCREFFYPTPEQHLMTDADGNTFDASKAKIDLAVIPFVRMRNEFSAKALDGSSLFGGRQRFSDAVALAQKGSSGRFQLDIPNLDLRYDGTPISGMGAKDLSLLCWLANRQANGRAAIDMQDDIVKNGRETGVDYAEFCMKLQALDEQFLSRRRIGGETTTRIFPELEKVITALSDFGFVSRTDFESRNSSLKSALTKLLGIRGGERFALKRFGQRGNSSYAFDDFEENFEVKPLTKRS